MCDATNSFPLFPQFPHLSSFFLVFFSFRLQGSACSPLLILEDLGSQALKNPTIRTRKLCFFSFSHDFHSNQYHQPLPSPRLCGSGH